MVLLDLKSLYVALPKAEASTSSPRRMRRGSKTLNDSFWSFNRGHSLHNKYSCTRHTMSKGVKYLLVSLPTSISRTNDHDEALTALRSAVTTDYGTVFPFQIPEFKIGTLDALVQQADDLSKLEAACEGVVSKVGDSLKAILEGDEEKIGQSKTVNDSS